MWVIEGVSMLQSSLNFAFSLWKYSPRLTCAGLFLYVSASSTAPRADYFCENFHIVFLVGANGIGSWSLPKADQPGLVCED